MKAIYCLFFFFDKSLTTTKLVNKEIMIEIAKITTKGIGLKVKAKEFPNVSPSIFEMMMSTTTISIDDKKKAIKPWIKD